MLLSFEIVKSISIKSKEILDLVHKVYRDNVVDFKAEDRYWVIAQHPIYGLVGGFSFLKLPPTSDLIKLVNGQVKRAGIASYLFYHPVSHLIKNLSQKETIALKQQFYRGIYQQFCDLAFVFEWDGFWLTFSVDQYNDATLENLLPFSQIYSLYYKNQTFVLGYLLIAENVHELFRHNLILDQMFLKNNFAFLPSKQISSSLNKMLNRVASCL